MNTKEKGITLIALVVTIIILLILAGVTLNMALSGDGLFSRARNAADSYKKAQDDEGKLMENLVDEMDKLSPKKAGTTVEVPKGENWEEDKVTPVADGKGSAVPIPKGFYYVGGNIDTGIVISDVENDDLNNSKHGNQFVWIPCTAGEYESAKDDVMEKEWTCADNYMDNGDTSEEKKTNGTGNGLGWHDNCTENENQKINETHTEIDTENWENDQTGVAKTSLEKYKGFFVARFEAGIPKEAISIYTETAGTYIIEGRGNSTETSSISSLRPISQKKVQVWNFITQPNAKMISENMYKDDTREVNSYLIDDVAWNVVCNKFNNVLGTREEGKSITNSTKIGNYVDNNTTKYTELDVLWAFHKYGENSKWTEVDGYKKGNISIEDMNNRKNINPIELATGSSEDFKIYNIYDIAGNVWEYTTGHYLKNETLNFVFRGGGFGTLGNLGCTTSRMYFRNIKRCSFWV